MTFTVLVHDAEESGYWAEVPELPGCGSQGETLDELEVNVREAIEAVLLTYEEEGQPVPAAAALGNAALGRRGTESAGKGQRKVELRFAARRV